MSELKNKLANYKSALGKLKEGLIKYDEANDLLRDGIIQRFEFTFELAWELLKEVFEDEGLKGLNSPKTVLREAFSAQIIDNEELWLLMLNDRNSTAHIYNESAAVAVYNNIILRYVPAFKEMEQKIEQRLSI